MALVNWTSEFSVDIPIFDEQHRKIVDMLNELHASIVQGRGADTARRDLARLASFAVQHFRHEEQLMQRYGYAELPLHRAEHAAMARHIAEFQGRLSRGEVAITVALLNYLRDWLVRHFLEMDRKYAEFFSEQGLAATVPV